MAYKSQVTQKWFGSTFKGAQRHLDARTTEMGQIVSALKNDFTPAMNKFADKYVENKQTEAGAKMQELYSKGWKTKKIRDAILKGDFPELKSTYVQAVVDKHTGRFEAAETIRKIQENKDDYNYKDTTQTIEDHFKKYLPNFNEASKEFTLGFASVFNEWAFDRKVEDAKLRATWAHEKKIMNGVKYLDTFAKQDMSTYFDKVKTLNTEMPNVNGKKAFYFDSDEMNEVAIAHAEWIYDTGKTAEDMALAIQILTQDRGIGKGKNKLGSLLSTRDPKVGLLFSKLEIKEARLVQIERRNEVYNKNREIEKIYADAFKGKEIQDLDTGETIYRPYNADELNDIIEKKLEPYGDPQLIINFKTFFSEDRAINNDPNVTNAFMMEIAEGRFDTYEEMIAELNTRGIPISKLATANQRWKTWIGSKDKGTSPVYLSEIEYSGAFGTIERDVLSSFTNKLTGITEKGGNEAVINARNYMKDNILAYEDKFFEENKRVPTHEERRKFMVDLGKHVMEVFRNTQEIAPESLISMEEKIKTEEAKEKLRIDVGVEDKKTLIDKNIQTLIDSGTIKLPLREDDPRFDDWIPFNQPSEKEFYTETLQPIVTDYVTQILKGVEFDKSYFGKDGILLPIEQQRLYNGIAKTIFGANFTASNLRAIKLIIKNMFNLTGE